MSVAETIEAHRERLLAAATEAQAMAYAPYSNFRVGAAVLLADGTVYQGSNIENASYGLTVCAERVALFKAVSEGHLDIVAIAVVTSAPTLARPCGACRQVISEFSLADNPVVILTACASGEVTAETITELLPHSFSLL